MLGLGVCTNVGGVYELIHLLIKIVLFDELMKMTNSFRLSIPYWL